MPRRLRLTGHARNVRADLATAQPAGKTDKSKSIEQSHARQILHLPPDQRDLIIGSLKEGAKPSVIANFFAEQGWLEVTEKSFRQYIIAFRRVYPETLRGNDQNSIDSIVDPRAPDLDEELTLQQLIKVQKIRLKRGLDFEARTQLPMKDLYKDVEVTKNLVESLATLRGRGTGTTGKNKTSTPMSNEASESLRKADHAENAQEKMIALTTQLVPLMRARANAKA